MNNNTKDACVEREVHYWMIDRGGQSGIPGENSEAAEFSVCCLGSSWPFEPAVCSGDDCFPNTAMKGGSDAWSRAGESGGRGEVLWRSKKAVLAGQGMVERMA